MFQFGGQLTPFPLDIDHIPGGVDDPQDRVISADEYSGPLQSQRLYLAAGPSLTGQVENFQASAGALQNSSHRIGRGSRSRINDGELLPHKRVQKRRFAGIGQTPQQNPGQSRSHLGRLSSLEQLIDLHQNRLE